MYVIQYAHAFSVSTMNEHLTYHVFLEKGAETFVNLTFLVWEFSEPSLKLISKNLRHSCVHEWNEMKLVVLST